jgi:hypothetical protein
MKSVVPGYGHDQLLYINTAMLERFKITTSKRKKHTSRITSYYTCQRRRICCVKVGFFSLARLMEY